MAIKDNPNAVPLYRWLQDKFKGNASAFNRYHGFGRTACATMVKSKRWYVLDGELIQVRCKAIIPVEHEYRVNGSMASRFLARSRFKTTNLDDLEEEIIDTSIKGERWGCDDKLYSFADGSKIIHRPLVGEWII